MTRWRAARENGCQMERNRAGTRRRVKLRSLASQQQSTHREDRGCVGWRYDISRDCTLRFSSTHLDGLACRSPVGDAWLSLPVRFPSALPNHPGSFSFPFLSCLSFFFLYTGPLLPVPSTESATRTGKGGSRARSRGRAPNGDDGCTKRQLGSAIGTGADAGSVRGARGGCLAGRSGDATVRMGTNDVSFERNEKENEQKRKPKGARFAAARSCRHVSKSRHATPSPDRCKQRRSGCPPPREGKWLVAGRERFPLPASASRWQWRFRWREREVGCPADQT